MTARQAFTKLEENAFRVQRRRTKGWRMPENSVLITRGSLWGNPYKVGINGNREECVGKFRAMAERNLTLKADTYDALRGKILVCWCRLNDICHGDVLLELANR